MKYFMNLCLVSALLGGEVEAMARGGHVAIQMNLNEPAEKSEISRSDFFRGLNSAMGDRNNNLVKFLAKEACRDRFRGWSEDQKTILLFYAVENGLEEVVEDCSDSRFNLNVRGYLGKTPLICATERGYNKIAEYLLESGADPNAADVMGFSPLMFASWMGNENLVRTLIRNKADVNALDITGLSALMFASWMGNENLVRILIKNNANVNALSNKGFSPLSLAMGNSQWEVVETLKNAGAILINQNSNTTPSIEQYYSRKSVEREREKTRWNAIINISKKMDNPREESVIAEPPARWSVWSFFRSFFRRFQTPGQTRLK